MTPPPPGPQRRERLARALAGVAADFRLELPGRLAQVMALMDACLANPADDGPLQALLLLLHSLGGTAGTLGLAEVGQAAQDGERLARALRQQGGSRSVGDFDALRACVDVLSARVREAGAAPG